jgi:capsular exopolysaccharide synthesis family protein
MIHTVFGLGNEPGLTNVLIDKVAGDHAIQHLENLAVLPSGTLPPNPSELLDSQKMRELLAALRRDHDIIILDSPPLLPVTDSVVLSAQVDGVLFVIKSGSTNREMALRAKLILRNSRTKIIGAILNNIDLKSVYGYYQAYYDYYTEKSAKPHGGIKGWIRALSPANGKAPVLE